MDNQEVTKPFATNQHIYADDMQLQKHIHPSLQFKTNHPILEWHVVEIKDWCLSKHLALKANKMEVISLGSREYRYLINRDNRVGWRHDTIIDISRL